MNALALMATLGLDTSNYEQGLKGAGGMAQSFASSFKKVLGGVAVAGGAAVTAAGAAVVSVVKSAVTAYKEFEQLEGGAALIFGKKGTFEEFASGASESLYQTGQRGEEVRKLQEEINALLGDGEKLVVDGIYGPKTQAALDQYANKLSSVQKSYETQGSAYDFMMGRADEAYKNVQMSASEYMAQVVGLGAGLKQSLGGDAQAAAELADKIITAEADVVAATGRPMEAVQNAFNGVLRGNYSMLDNLGIGIKASKEGMKDVIDAVNDWNKAQGKATKYRQGNLADEQAALVDYIEMVGYAGYAEREALGTLEGSFAATKASWKDMLVEFGRGGNIQKAMGKLVTAGKAVVTNLIPVVKNALTSVGTFVGEIAPVIAQELPEIITEAGPAFLNAIGSLAGSLISNFPAMLSGIGSAIKTAITGSDDASWAEVGAQIWEKIKSGISATGDWLKGLVGLTPDDSWSEFGLVIWEKVKSGINATGDWLKEQLGYTPDASWSEIGTQLWETVKSGISGTGDWLKEKLGYSPDSSWSQIGADIWSIIKQGISDTGDWLKGQLGYTPDDSWSQIGADIWEMVKSGISATGDWLKSALGYTPSDEWSTVGKDILEKIKGGIGDVASVLTGLFESASTAISTIDWTSVGSGIWNAIKAGIGGLFSVFQSLFGEGKDGAEAVDWAGLGASILNAVTTALASIGETIFGFFSAAWADITADPALIALGDTIKKPFDDAWTAIQSAWNGAASWFDGIISGVQTTFDNIATAVNSALTAVSDFFGFSPTDIFSSVAESIAGTFAKIAGAVQGAIDKVREFFGLTGGEEFTRTEPRKSAGLGVLPQYNARAMNTGHIFNRPTLFGFADGKFQVAGDAGAEAVVGVNSLDSMIQKAVSNAMAGVLGKMDELRAGQGRDMQLVLDSGELVGGIANQMNRRLGSISRWREGGHA